MWVTKLLISPVKKKDFLPKMTKYSPKLAFLSIAGSFGALLVGWLMVLARAVSPKTPIDFILDYDSTCSETDFTQEEFNFHATTGIPNSSSYCCCPPDHHLQEAGPSF